MEQLPKLPIPSLEQSIDKYLATLHPLQSSQEHEHTKIAARKFIDNIGPALQQKLINYNSQQHSYIHQFWYDSYLNYNSSLVLNLNPFFIIQDDPNPANSSQLTRSANVTYSTLKFINQIKTNTLPPDTLKDGSQLCHYQYSKLFSTARIPTPAGCILKTFNSNHMVVLSNSNFYYFDVLHPTTHEIIITPQQLKSNISTIIKDSKTASNPIGLLTTESRPTWSKIRQSVVSSEINSKILDIIDSALFILVLDDFCTGDIDLQSKNVLCGISEINSKGQQVGTCANRWFDKLQIIVTKSSDEKKDSIDSQSGTEPTKKIGASVGINFEHTGIDGHTVLGFVSFIYLDCVLSFAESINPMKHVKYVNQSEKPIPNLAISNNFQESDKVTSNHTSSHATISSKPDPTLKKLEWEITKQLSLHLRFAETKLSDHLNQTQLSTLEYTNYGSNHIKKFGLSPDAFVQMSFQMCYFMIYGKLENVYEPAMTKKFHRGRTEGIRSVTDNSLNFVKFVDETYGICDGGGFDFEKLLNLKNLKHKQVMNKLKLACSTHSKLTKESSNGFGIDRHLYALYCIWKMKFEQTMQEDADTDKNDDSDDSIISISSASNNGDSDFLKIPELFTDSGWSILNTTIISTSNCGNPSLKNFGFGPVDPNGFGLGYIIKDDSITICGTSNRRQTKRFLQALSDWFNFIDNVWKNSIGVDDQEVIEYEKTVVHKEQITKEDKREIGGYGYFDNDNVYDNFKSVSSNINFRISEY